MTTPDPPLADPLPLAVVGFFGVIGRRHVAEVRALPATRLVALVDPAPASAAAAAELGVAHYATVEALLAADTTGRPAAAIVCSPNHTHAAAARALAAAGVHLLVEKPLSVSAAEGAALVRDLDRSGVRVLVGHQRRFDRHVQAAQRALAAGRLGAVTAVSALWTARKPAAYFAAAPWRHSRAAGGGVLRINLVHEVDVLQYWLGPIVRVHAEATPRRRRDDDDDDDDAPPEGAALTFRFRSGVVGTCLVSDHVASPYSYEAATRTNPAPLSAVGGAVPVDAYRLFGTDAALSVPDMQLWAYGPGQEPGWLTPLQREVLSVADDDDDDDDDRSPMTRQLAHFVDVVRGTAAPRCSAADAVRAVAVCDAVERALASESGTAVVEGEESV